MQKANELGYVLDIEVIERCTGPDVTRAVTSVAPTDLTKSRMGYVGIRGGTDQALVKAVLDAYGIRSNASSITIPTWLIGQ